MAHRALVDAHIRVSPRISVSEGHNIAERARARVQESHPTVINVLVHVDAEDDIDHDANAQRMPGRDELMLQLAPLLEGLPNPERVLFHYLNGKIEAEVFFSHRDMVNGAAMADAERQIAQRLRSHKQFSAVSVNCLVGRDERPGQQI
jgi:hypothetical protein